MISSIDIHSDNGQIHHLLSNHKTELVQSVVGIRYISGEILLQAGGILLDDKYQVMRCQSRISLNKNEA